MRPLTRRASLLATTAALLAGPLSATALAQDPGEVSEEIVVYADDDDPGGGGVDVISIPSEMYETVWAWWNSLPGIGDLIPPPPTGGDDTPDDPPEEDEDPCDELLETVEEESEQAGHMAGWISAIGVAGEMTIFTSDGVVTVKPGHTSYAEVMEDAEQELERHRGNVRDAMATFRADCLGAGAQVE